MSKSTKDSKLEKDGKTFNPKGSSQGENQNVFNRNNSAKVSVKMLF
jgi:hypothetical protein